MRLFITADPFQYQDEARDWNKRGMWPCRWVSCPGADKPPFVTAYRCRFTLDEPATIIAHVTADERYILFLNGRQIGRGSERGDANHWFFETYRFDLEPGEHVFVAQVWSLGEQAPFAQMSVTPGFLFVPQNEAHQKLLGTGIASWEAKVLGGYTFKSPQAAWGTGANLIIDGAAFDWGFETGEGDGWQPVLVGEWGSAPTRNDCPVTQKLIPAMLPPMMDVHHPFGRVCHVSDIPTTTTHAMPFRDADDLPEEKSAWQDFLDDKNSETLTVPAHTRRRILVDLQNYFCGYPLFISSGGAGSMVRVHWQESLFNEPNTKTKGNRDEYLNKYFVTIWHVEDGIGDTFLPNGSEYRTFETLWWQCGRWVEIVVETKEEPLVFHLFALTETRYPLEQESRFASSDSRLADDIAPLALRTLQMCAHETYMDCPYYEQLQYIGDTRIQALITYAISRDDRLARKALTMFNASRQLSGLTQSRYPTRVSQIIPTFSLWHVLMLHDYAMWRDDFDFVKSLLPGARGVLDFYLSLRNADGLITAPEGWNTLDWVPDWPHGNPPDADRGVSGVVNWMVALTLRRLAELEEWANEPENAARARRHADDLMGGLLDHFWDEERGLFADDLAHSRWSEHAQIFALLSGYFESDLEDEHPGWDHGLRIADGLLNAPDLARATIYFSHYLFEVYHLLDRTDKLIERLGLWFDLKANGLKTTIEMPEPTRSDCHAWGAHPLYHFFATILGIHPASPRFRTVSIAPNLGPLEWVEGDMVHPLGTISVRVEKTGDSGVSAHVCLPDSVHGWFRYGKQVIPLQSGEQTFCLPAV